MDEKNLKVIKANNDKENLLGSQKSTHMQHFSKFIKDGRLILLFLLPVLNISALRLW